MVLWAQIFIPDEAGSSAAPGGSASGRPAGRASSAPDSLNWQHRTDAAAVAAAPAQPGARGPRGAQQGAEAMPEWWNPSPALHVSPAYKQEVQCCSF